MTVAIRKLTVPRQMQLIAQGQTVVIVAEIVDTDVTAVLLDPVNIPVISIYNSVGTAVVTDAVMTKLSTGVYKYEFQTTMSSVVGVYTVNITAVHIDEVARVERVVAFKIVRSSTLATFNYLAIKDQNAVVWYWYIASDNTLAVSSTIPTSLGKQAAAIIIAVTPSWLEINNPTPALRYVYPTLTGDPLAQAAQPAVGTGNVGSPTIVGIAGGSFKIAVNLSDSVILQTV